MKSLLTFLFVLLSCFTLPLKSYGQELTTVEEASTTKESKTDDGIIWHHFISQGYFKSSKNNYLGNSKEGSFDFTEAGLNVRKALSNKVDTGAQLFARKLGPNEDFDVKFDWLYANYQHSDWFKFKVGRIKIPFGLFNEMSDIDAARVPILLPQSTYPAQSRDYLLAQNGAQAYGQVDSDKMGSLVYHLYGGSINIDKPAVTSTTTIITRINVPYLVGGRLLWETPLNGLNTAFSLKKMEVDIDVTVSGVPIKTHFPVTEYLASAEYSRGQFTFITEYGQTEVETQTNSTLFPSTKVKSERYYFMTNYQITESIAPGVYYSRLISDRAKPYNHENTQGDLALYIRYDFNNHWLLKLEGHMMNGKAGLNSALNDNQAKNRLSNDWEVIMAKTTIYF